MPQVTVTPLPSRNPNPPNSNLPSHHVGSPAQYYQNPWPSSKKSATLDALRIRFRGDRNFVPVPDNKDELVKVISPTWGWDKDLNGKRLKATWIGHASWLVEGPIANREGVTGDSPPRAVRILLDPVFSERTSPVQWFGPKRYNPTPCSLADLPEVDIIAISHNHYDHLDLHTITELWKKNRDTQFLVALGNKSWFLSLNLGIGPHNVTELDWWDSVEAKVHGIGNVSLTCTPAQHSSARSGWDKDKALWCSWVLEFGVQNGEGTADGPVDQHKLFFAGDTGYRYVPSSHPSREEEKAQPVCPAFREIGETFGPFNLALLPIGLYNPRDFMSTIHCAPDDAICVHSDIRSKRSIGMHYGTVRGGLSQYYEDVREPPRRWKELCDEAGLSWGEEVGLCDIGETVFGRP